MKKTKSVKRSKKRSGKKKGSTKNIWKHDDLDRGSILDAYGPELTCGKEKISQVYWKVGV